MPRQKGQPFMDVGEALSQVVTLRFGRKALHQIPLTSKEGPGMAGSVFGDVVYHNFYATQGRADRCVASDLLWSRAVEQYLS